MGWEVAPDEIWWQVGEHRLGIRARPSHLRKTSQRRHDVAALSPNDAPTSRLHDSRCPSQACDETTMEKRSFVTIRMDHRSSLARVKRHV